MSRLVTMSRFEEHPALPEPWPDEPPEPLRKPRREHRLADSPEQVRACLSCPKPACTNCLERRRGRPYVPARSKLDARARGQKIDHPALDGQARHP